MIKPSNNNKCGTDNSFVVIRGQWEVPAVALLNLILKYKSVKQ
jgi:hypothetical protein